MLLPQKIARSQRSKLVGCNSENHFGSFSEVLFDLLKLAHGEPKNLLASPSKKKKTLATCGTFPWPGNWNWKLRSKLLALNWVTPIDLDVLCINWKGAFGKSVLGVGAWCRCHMKSVVSWLRSCLRIEPHCLQSAGVRMDTLPTLPQLRLPGDHSGQRLYWFDSTIENFLIFCGWFSDTIGS